MKKSIYSRIAIAVPGAVLLSLLLLTVVFLVVYYKGLVSEKSGVLIGGLVTGLLIATMQFMFGWVEYRTLVHIQSVGVHNILLNRDNREFYQALIDGSKREIMVMGVTANRFMEHFADHTSADKGSRVLLTALSRGVRVRILVADPTYLTVPRDKRGAETAAELFAKTAESNSDFQYRYFGHVATHSIVVVDDVCILGPVFPEVSSKNTPAMHIDRSSEFSRLYMEYFEREWGQTHQITLPSGSSQGSIPPS